MGCKVDVYLCAYDHRPAPDGVRMQQVGLRGWHQCLRLAPAITRRLWMQATPGSCPLNTLHHTAPAPHHERDMSHARRCTPDGCGRQCQPHHARQLPPRRLLLLPVRQRQLHRPATAREGGCWRAQVHRRVRNGEWCCAWDCRRARCSAQRFHRCCPLNPAHTTVWRAAYLRQPAQDDA